MSQVTSPDDSRNQHLEQVLAEYLHSVEVGQPIDRRELMSRHPDLADELRSFFGNRDAMQQLASPLQEAAGKIATGELPTIVLGDGTIAEPTICSRLRYFGDYELLGEIARGGMGVVYKARQVSLKRTVALKMILSGQLASADDVNRFHREAEAAANLDHPHIVPIYEIGEHEGQHYFSMKLIEGGSLSQLLREHPSGLPLRDSAKLMVTVARAVHHAHQRGLLHRDLKPSNILLDSADEPQVTDFGLATHVDGGSDLTGSGSVLGTPNYMAPEQARAQKQLSTAADVYSLGAILYELLCGRPPFRGETAIDTIMQVLSRAPQRPQSVNPRIDRDLETICLKCLDKEPQRRYDSAAAMADDLDRWLWGEPILARPAGKTERIVKWARRHPSVAALSVALLVVLVVGFSLVTWKWREASNRADAETLAKNAETRAKEAAGRALERSQQLAFAAQLWRAIGLLDSDPVLAAKTLDDEEVCPPDRRDFCWRYYHHQGERMRCPFEVADGPVFDASISSDGKWMATRLSKDRAVLIDFASGKVHAEFPSDGDVRFNTLLFSPDGKTLAVGGKFGQVTLRAVPDGAPVATLEWTIPDGRRRHLSALAFSPDGKSLAVGGSYFDEEKNKTDGDGRWRYPLVWLWDLAAQTGKVLTSEPRLKGGRMSDSGVICLAYSPDGKTLAVGLTRESSILMLDAQTGDERQRFHPEAGWIGSVAFSHDGKMVACGNSTSNIFIYDLSTRKLTQKLEGHLGHIDTLLFTTAGLVVSSAPRDRTIRVWDAGTGRQLALYRLQSFSEAVQLLPGEHELVVVTSRQTEVWSLDAQPALATLRAPKAKDGTTGNSALAFDDKGNRLAVVGQDEIVRVWDVADQKLVRDLVGHQKRSTAVAFGPAGSDLLVSGGEDKQVLLWQMKNAEPLKPIVLEGHSGHVSCLAITPDGSIVVSGSLDGTVRLWDSVQGKLAHTIVTGDPQIRSVALSGDGTRLITGGQDGSLRVWSISERKRIEMFPSRFKAPISQVAMAYDGKTAATIQNQSIALYDLGSGGEARPQNQISAAASVAFTPDGKTLAVGCSDRIVRLYDVASGHLRGELPGHSHEVARLAFNHDATLLATSSRGNLRWDRTGEVMLWSAPVSKSSSRTILPGTQKFGNGQKSSWSPDGNKIYLAMSPGINCVDLKSEVVTRLTGEGGDPACSPAGNVIAYVQGQGNQEEIWLIEPDGSHNRKLIDGGFPCWLSDGKTLCFHARKQDLIQSVDVTASKIVAKTLLDHVGSWYPTVSPNGKLAAVVRDGNLVVTNLATKERQTCPLRGAGAGFTGWSPDSSQVGFGGFGGDYAGLWIFHIPSGKVKQVAGGSCTMPVWSPDGKWLSYDVRGTGEVWALETKAFELIPWDDPTKPKTPEPAVSGSK